MELLRREPLLGSNKVIIGSPTEELVLETLGKLYIKQQNSFIDVIECLENLNSSDSDSTYESKVEFTLNIAAEDPTVYKDGIFMFDVSSLRLYLVYKNKFRFVTDLKANSESDVFIKRDGSTDMSGTLVIKTTDVPLQVTSKKLVKNLNAELFDSNTTDAFAMKEKNETIKGDYTFNGASEFNGTAKFNNKTTFNRIATFNRESVFNDNSTFNRNIIANGNIRQATGDFITDGSIGSSSFASGFTGHGWRLDANTNTLTIDNLVVRGILSVFELVVNKISATNGSLWVTDSFKVGEVKPVTEVGITDLGSLDNFFSEPQYEKYYKNDTAKTTEEELTNDEADEVTEEEGSEETTKEIKSSSFIIFYENSVSVDDPSYNAESMNRIIINASNQYNYVSSGISVYNRSGLNLRSFPYYVYYDFYRINTSSTITGGVATNVESHELLQYPLFISNYIRECIFTATYTFAPISLPYSSGIPVANVKSVSSIEQLIALLQQLELLEEETIPTSEYVCTLLVSTNTYFLYFCNNPMFVLYPDDEADYPNFQPGDLLKCQKFTGNSIKQYNAIVLNTAEDFILILLGTGPLDYYTEYHYDSEGNMTNSTSERLVDDLGRYITKFIPEKGDTLVRIGNIFNTDRQGSLFLTSSEQYSPYIDTMSGVCRPDYNISYWEPEFETVQLNLDGKSTIVYPFTGPDTSYASHYGSEGDEDEFWYTFMPTVYTPTAKTTIGNTEYINCKLKSYTRARFGRLDGIYNEYFGNHQPHGYGLYGENVFLTGEFYLNNGKSVVSFGDDIRLVSASTQLALEQVNQNLNGFSLNILNVVSEMNLLRTSTKNIIKNASTLTESNLTDYWNLVGCDTTTYQASDVGYEGLETIQLGNYYVKSAVFGVMDTSLLNTQIIILDGTFNLIPSTQYVLSLYVKADLSTEDPDLRNIIFLGASLQSHTITNGINRYYYTFTTASSLDTYIATRLRVLYQVYDDTYGYQGSIPIQIYGTQLEQGSTPTAFEDLGQSATLMIAEEKAKQAATNTLNSEFADMLLDNTSAFAHAYSTAAKTPDGGAAFAASYALAAGRAGLQLTGVSYNSSTGVQVANSSKIGLIADAIDIKNYIYWDSAEEEYVERIPDNDLGGYLQKIYYTTVSPLPNLNIWNLTANDIHVGWILTYEIPSKTTAVSFPVNVTILDELGESKILSWQYYYENSLGYTIFANDTTGNYPYKPGSAISFLNASAVNFILYTLSAALFENGKIKAQHIDVETLKTDLLRAGIIDALEIATEILESNDITARNVVAAPDGSTTDYYFAIFEDGNIVPKDSNNDDYITINHSTGSVISYLNIYVKLINGEYYMFEASTDVTNDPNLSNCSLKVTSSTTPSDLQDSRFWDGESTWYDFYLSTHGEQATNIFINKDWVHSASTEQLTISDDTADHTDEYQWPTSGFYTFTPVDTLQSFSGGPIIASVHARKIQIISKKIPTSDQSTFVTIDGYTGEMLANGATIIGLKCERLVKVFDTNVIGNGSYSPTSLSDLYDLQDFCTNSNNYLILPDSINYTGREITILNSNNQSNVYGVSGIIKVPFVVVNSNSNIDSFNSFINKVPSYIASNSQTSATVWLPPFASCKLLAKGNLWILTASTGYLQLQCNTYVYDYVNGLAWLHPNNT